VVEAAHTDKFLPRRPKQKRGIERFESILDATHHLLETRSMSEISHYDLAEEVGCAPATIYHLFPSMNAVYYALSDRYAQAWVDILERDEPADAVDDWQHVVRLKFDECREYYNATPPALQIFLGLGTTREIRMMDRELNQRLGAAMWRAVRVHFLLPEADYLDEKFALAIEMSDALWSLSYAQHGNITDEMAEETFVAIFSYLENYIPRYLPRRPSNGG
jgi:AcrR family transcriptional regulator